MSAESDDHWDECPEGTIRSMVNQQNNANRRQFIKVVGGASMLTVAAAGTGVYLLGNRDQGRGIFVGGMWCDQVAAEMKPFIQGDLDQRVSQKVQAHLAQCHSCKEMVDKMRGLV